VRDQLTELGKQVRDYVRALPLRPGLTPLKLAPDYEWPLARAVSTPYYLHADGSLPAAPPASNEAGADEPTHYLFDPRHPVPTLGGNTAHMLPPASISCGYCISHVQLCWSRIMLEEATIH
jgi:hypothetical protein